jgi:hypothetical protein
LSTSGWRRPETPRSLDFDEFAVETARDHASLIIDSVDRPIRDVVTRDARL